MCQGGKPGTGKLYTDVCLCCSAHTSGCVVDGLGATATLLLLVVVRNDIAEGLRHAWLCTLLISSSATGSRLRTVIILGEGLVAWAELGLLREGLRMREAVSHIFQELLVPSAYGHFLFNPFSKHEFACFLVSGVI